MNAQNNPAHRDQTKPEIDQEVRQMKWMEEELQVAAVLPHDKEGIYHDQFVEDPSTPI